MTRLLPAFCLICATWAASGVGSPARAATPVSLLTTAAPSFLAAYVALDQGFFARHGLDVTLTTAPNPSTIPAALLSGSSDIGGLQAIVLLQAADQGLDLVAVAGTEAYPAPYRQGLLARPGGAIKGPADLAGKRLAVPGIGSTMDILVRLLFANAAIDDHGVTRVEVAMQQLADPLRAGSVDAVAAVDPTYSRIVDAGIGVPVGSWESLIPKGTFLSLYAADRAWSARNEAALAAFRAALDDATAFIAEPENAASSRASMTRYTRLPPTVVNAMALPRSLTTVVTPASLAFWSTVGQEQNLLTHGPDLAALIAK